MGDQVHIMVFGYDTTEFSLLAMLADATIMLNNGVPQKGSVSSTGEQYYSYQALSDCTVVLVATVTSGLDPALYLSGDVERPNATSPHTVSRPNDAGQGTLPTLQLQGITTGQMVYAGVAGAGANVTYVVRVYEVPSDSVLPPTLLSLLDGVPQVVLHP